MASGGEHPEEVAASPGGIVGGGRLVGTRIEPAELEREFRAATLREDGRSSALVVAPVAYSSWLLKPRASRKGWISRVVVSMEPPGDW